MEGKKRKKFPWLAVVLLVLVLGLGAAAGVFFTRNTLVDGRIIPVDSVNLDLRDAGIGDVRGLRRCKGLQSVDLRGNDLDEDSLRELQEALPDCQIRCDVTLGGEWYDVNTAELTVPGSAVYFEELLSQLPWFRNLRSVKLEQAELTPEQQRTLLRSFGDVEFRWTVAAGSRRLSCATEQVLFSGAESGDLAALEEVMDLLPALKKVDFSDSPVSPEDRAAFREAHPELEVDWSVTLMGEVYPCDTQMLDLNNRELGEDDLDLLREAIPYLPALEKIEMRHRPFQRAAGCLQPRVRRHPGGLAGVFQPGPLQSAHRRRVFPPLGVRGFASGRHRRGHRHIALLHGYAGAGSGTPVLHGPLLPGEHAPHDRPEHRQVPHL